MLRETVAGQRERKEEREGKDNVGKREILKILMGSHLSSILPLVSFLQRLFVNAFSRDAEPDSLVWSAGDLLIRRWLLHAVRNYATLPGPACIWTSDWVCLPPSAVIVEDVNAWLYSVGIFGKNGWLFSAFCIGLLMELIWVLGGSLMILIELWACERLVLEKAEPRYRRPRRPISSWSRN